jgi:RNA polymerase sigma factor (sigma-70 family)
MEGQNCLAQQFEENRTRLKKVAFRMLGSTSEADDAVQETWLRLSRSDARAIDNLAGWLTTVVARICLDMLRSRKARREESLDIDGPSQIVDAVAGDPERDAILADSIGPALLVVLDMLTPPERVAFVLHDMFGMAFEEIAPIIGRSATASRQLASRARRRVHGSAEDATARGSETHRRGGAGAQRARAETDSDGERDKPSDGGNRKERRIVDAFLAAARDGDLEALLSVLDPECVLRADEFASALGAPRQVKGGTGVAGFFNGRAAEAMRATIRGVAAAAWAPGGKLRVAFSFTFRDERIADIELIADRTRMQQLDIVLLDG